MEEALQARSPDTVDYGELALTSERLTRGLGILSWKGYESLRPMLARLIESGVADQFDERFIFFPEIDDEARAIAAEHNFTCDGSPANLGIFGGFQALARGMSSDTILLLENDLLVAEPVKESRRQLGIGFELLEREAVKVVCLRHRKHPGDFEGALKKYQRFFPPSDAGTLARLGGIVLRHVRAEKATRLIGHGPYAEEFPERRFSEIAVDQDTGFMTIGTQCKSWTNQSIAINRRFYLDVILDYVERADTTRRVNGFKNIEIELNNQWWRDQPWEIAVAPGLFTHQREGDRGY